MDEIPEMTIGGSVRRHREALGLTREDFARQVGTSTSTIARLELMDQLPRVATLAAIAAFLGLSLDGLVGEKASA
jgi:transcriptional regulator with XRE-family HTH domain